MKNPIKLDQLLNLIYPQLNKDEYIRMQAMKNGKVIACPVFQCFPDIVRFTNAHKNDNVFYSIATTDGNGNQISHLKSVSAIVLDFDFKENGVNKPKPDPRPFWDMLQDKLDIYIAVTIDSGHGYHIVIGIETTNDIDRWNKITKELAEIYGADMKATIKTQLMRMPYSFNVKDENNKLRVNIVSLKTDNLKRYTLNELETIIRNKKQLKIKNEYQEIKPCITNMLNGTTKGNRNFALGRIISYFRNNGLKKEEIFNIANEFNNKCTPPKPTKEFNSEFEIYWKHPEYNLNGCHIPNKDEDDKLRQFCVSNCSYTNIDLKNLNSQNEKVLTLHKYEESLINIPVTYVEPKTKLTGFQIALGVELTKLNKTTKGELYDLYSHIPSRTLRKHLKVLQDKKLIYIEGNTIRVRQSSSKNIGLNYFTAKSMLNGKISSAQYKVYTAICYFNANNIEPTEKRVSTEYAIDYSNCCKYINQLIELNIVTARCNRCSFKYYYSLSAA